MARRTRQISLQECYDILKLEKDADMAALKRSYRRRAFELHPDLHPDNPEASHDFQLLNEAYVALSAMLEHEEQVRASANARRATREAKKQAAQKTAEAKDATASAEQSSTTSGKDTTDSQSKTEGAGEQQATSEQTENRQRTQNAYTEHDVLRDLLNDPFARRVFEDIYSELNRKQKEENKKQPEPPHQESPKPEQPKKPVAEKRNVTLHKDNIAWGTAKWNKDMSRGMTGMVKGWLRKQIDEEQHLTLPSANLAPGRRIRLQIRQALSGELKTIEITLPPDFTPGKPIRLRGLGKRVGPWQGDLYLTISNT